MESTELSSAVFNTCFRYSADTCKQVCPLRHVCQFEGKEPQSTWVHRMNTIAEALDA
jgi:hypothetical protein